MFDYLSFPERSLLKADRDKLTLFKKTWINTQWNINIITFNYTLSMEKLIGDKHKNMQIGTHANIPIILHGIEHIHGYIRERMIMGVNDISQITNSSFHNNQDILEAIVKNKCNQVQKHTIDELCKQQISSANLICIFGSSIGDTDNLWWDLIGQQLKRNCNLIIFNRCKDISPQRGYLVGRLEREMKEYFLSKTNLTDEEKMKSNNIIFVGINTDMFKEIASTVAEEKELI